MHKQIQLILRRKSYSNSRGSLESSAFRTSSFRLYFRIKNKLVVGDVKCCDSYRMFHGIFEFALVAGYCEWRCSWWQLSQCFSGSFQRLVDAQESLEGDVPWTLIFNFGANLFLFDAIFDGVSVPQRIVPKSAYIFEN